MFLAKAPFSAYVLGIVCFKLGRISSVDPKSIGLFPLVPKPPRPKAQLLQDANATKSQMLAFYNSQAFSGSSWERGSGGVKSTGVSQSVRETGRDESTNSSSQFFRDLSQVVLPHSAGYTRTSVHPYFPVAKLRATTDLKKFEPKFALQLAPARGNGQPASVT